MSKRRSSRRDFLKGKAATDAMADVVADTAANRPDPSEGYFVRVTRQAMACEFEIRLGAGCYENGTEAALEALDLVEQLEEQMSVFRPASDVCRINDSAADGPVEVEPGLFELLQLGLDLYEDTDGAFDLTAGPLWEAWGFARREGAVPSKEEVADALQRVGSHLLRIDDSTRTVRFRRPGVQLNLGSIGKGYALDRCAEMLTGGGIGDFLIHGGQSSVLARGSQTSSNSTDTGQLKGQAEPGWTVSIVHPLRGHRRLAEIRLGDRALATSGSQAQSFVYKGRRYGHVLDPRTGRPAGGVLAATAIAPSAALADALSTAFYVMGPDKVIDFCRSRTDVAAVLVCPVRHSGGIEMLTAGLDEDELIAL